MFRSLFDIQKSAEHGLKAKVSALEAPSGAVGDPVQTQLYPEQIFTVVVDPDVKRKTSANFRTNAPNDVIAALAEVRCLIARFRISDLCLLAGWPVSFHFDESVQMLGISKFDDTRSLTGPIFIPFRFTTTNAPRFHTYFCQFCRLLPAIKPLDVAAQGAAKCASTGSE